jgi:hypothetical protein
MDLPGMSNPDDDILDILRLSNLCSGATLNANNHS